MSDSRINPSLMFVDQAREAIEFYHGIFGGTLNIQTFAEAPIETPPELGERVIHAELSSDSIVLMANDAMPGMQVNPGDNVSISIVGTDHGELAGWFEQLAAGGAIGMPLEKQFWGDTFGTLTDKFGTQWMVNIVAPENQDN